MRSFYSCEFVKIEASSMLDLSILIESMLHNSLHYSGVDRRNFCMVDYVKSTDSVERICGTGSNNMV